MKKNDSVKLIAALVIFIAAGLLIAWNLGVFSPAPSTTSDGTAPDRPHPGGGGAVAH